MRLVRRSGFAGAVAAAALIVGVLPATAAPGDGSAFAADVDVSLAGAPAVTVGPLAPSNTEGPTSAQLAGLSVPGVLTTGAVGSTANRDNSTGVVRATSTLADVQLVLGNLGSIGAIEVGCDATQKGQQGWTTLAKVKLAGAGVGAEPAPNTTVNVPPGPVPPPLATITFNEQIRNSDGSLTVNGVHIRPNALLGSGDVILGQARCGPAGPPIPLASGAGLWLGLGVVGLAAVVAGFVVVRRRSSLSTG